MKQPLICMIAGPNGAGKTTAAMKLLPNFLAVHEFVNADTIAAGLNPLLPQNQAIAAGRIMLQRIDGLIEAKQNFAFETTGSSHVFLNRFSEAKLRGYRTALVYLWLPTAEFAINRVKQRVLQGGHFVPDKDVIRRYARGIKNVIDLYLPLVDTAAFIDSTTPDLGENRCIASKNIDGDWFVVNRLIWQEMEKEAQKK